MNAMTVFAATTTIIGVVYAIITARYALSYSILIPFSTPTKISSISLLLQSEHTEPMLTNPVNFQDVRAVS
jgi:hypothetical protein